MHPCLILFSLCLCIFSSLICLIPFCTFWFCLPLQSHRATSSRSSLSAVLNVSIFHYAPACSFAGLIRVSTVSLQSTFMTFPNHSHIVYLCLLFFRLRHLSLLALSLKGYCVILSVVLVALLLPFPTPIDPSWDVQNKTVYRSQDVSAPSFTEVK